jgi:phage tail-like protein
MPAGVPTIVVPAGFRLKVGARDWVFREISVLDSESEVIEVRKGPDRKTQWGPGSLKRSNIELKRGIDVNNKELWEWRKQVIDGKFDDARANGTIEVFDQRGDPIVVYSIKNAWPSKYTAAMSLEPGSAFESITIAHEGIERI